MRFSMSASKSILRTIAGIALVFLGILGIFLPFLPGVVLIYFGLKLLDPSRRLLGRVKSFLKLPDKNT